SEKDQGQSHALGKGLERATGQIFGWLNSDDALLPGALQQVGEAFAADPQLVVFGGRVVHRNAEGDKVFERLNDPSDPDALFNDPVINQPATFFRLDAVRAVGGVDPALRYVMDLSLWWRLLFRFGPERMRFEPVELAVFRLHEASKTVSEYQGFLDETASLLHHMAMDTGLAEHAQVLASMHALRSGLLPVPVTDRHRERVRGMVVHFLLKWYGTIHSRSAFHGMRRLLHLEQGRAGRSAWEQERIAALEDQFRTSSWLLFRLRRKWQHLRS
ncbi:MAG: glycosyltransferase, partial [Flavobacteriales bacterium]|nr:glycosyltransferase [Flavobacteriales bacterium]